MKNFLIGQFDKFDEKKYKRDYKEVFYGIEACSFENEEEIEKLVEYSKRDGFKVGVHFPLRKGIRKLRDANIIVLDNQEREDAFKYVCEEMEYLKRVKPEYVLFHYPKPVVIDENVDWKNWRFEYREEYVYESEFSRDEFEKRSFEAIEYIRDKGDEINTRIIIELDGINRYIYDGDFLDRLLERYPKIELCIDLARIHFQDSIDENFNGMEFVKRYAKYVRHVHLSNIKVNEIAEHGHYPPLKELKTEDGWGDMEEYLKIIARVNKDFTLLFEHASQLITDEELEECYQWVDKIIN